MSFLGEIFAFGSLGFCAVMFAVGILVSILVDEERLGQATCVALGTFGLLWLLGDFHPVTFVTEHPGQALLAIPAYVAIAIFWGIAKWKLFLIGRRKRVDAVAVAFDAAMREEERRRARPSDDTSRGRSHTSYEREDLDKQAAELASEGYRKARWQDMLREAGIREPVKPLASQNKARIIAWMTYWPASMTWTLINDPVRHTFEFVYGQIGSLLQGMSDKTFQGVEDIYESRTNAR